MLSLRRGIGDAAGHASSQRNHAEVLLALGRLEEALNEATAALAAKRQLEDRAYLRSASPGGRRRAGRSADCSAHARRSARSSVTSASDGHRQLGRLVSARGHRLRRLGSPGTSKAPPSISPRSARGAHWPRPAARRTPFPLYWLVRFLHDQGAARTAARGCRHVARVERRRGRSPDAKSSNAWPRPCSPAPGARDAGSRHLLAALDRPRAVSSSGAGRSIATCRARAAGSAEHDTDCAVRRRSYARQADALQKPELRACYLAQRERAELLQAAGPERSASECRRSPANDSARRDLFPSWLSTDRCWYGLGGPAPQEFWGPTTKNHPADGGLNVSVERCPCRRTRRRRRHDEVQARRADRVVADAGPPVGTGAVQRSS